jgi:general stress protein 26
LDAAVVDRARALVEKVIVGWLATAGEVGARVRPMGAKWIGERELWFHTVTGTRKIAQIDANPEVEVCFRDERWNHVRIAGCAHVSRNDADKAALCEAWPEILGRYSGPSDPRFTVLRLLIRRIEYSPTGLEGYEVSEF